jgi:two-component system, OmpR family, response regulator
VSKALLGLSGFHGRGYAAPKYSMEVFLRFAYAPILKLFNDLQSERYFENRYNKFCRQDILNIPMIPILEQLKTERSDMKNISLLLVDDEDDFRTTLANRLKRRNFDVTDADSGEKALEIMKNNSFDVAIIDIKMPGIDGIETLKRVKKIDPHMEVILLTGHASIEAGIEGIKSGAYDYVIKPCTVNDLMVKIVDAFRRGIIEKEHAQES